MQTSLVIGQGPDWQACWQLHLPRGNMRNSLHAINCQDQCPVSAATNNDWPRLSSNCIHFSFFIAIACIASLMAERHLWVTLSIVGNQLFHLRLGCAFAAAIAWWHLKFKQPTGFSWWWNILTDCHGTKSVNLTSKAQVLQHASTNRDSIRSGLKMILSQHASQLYFDQTLIHHECRNWSCQFVNVPKEVQAAGAWPHELLPLFHSVRMLKNLHRVNSDCPESCRISSLNQRNCEETLTTKHLSSCQLPCHWISLNWPTPIETKPPLPRSNMTRSLGFFEVVVKSLLKSFACPSLLLSLPLSRSPRPLLLLRTLRPNHPSSSSSTTTASSASAFSSSSASSCQSLFSQFQSSSGRSSSHNFHQVSQSASSSPSSLTSTTFFCCFTFHGAALIAAVILLVLTFSASSAGCSGSGCLAYRLMTLDAAPTYWRCIPDSRLYI